MNNKCFIINQHVFSGGLLKRHTQLPPYQNATQSCVQIYINHVAGQPQDELVSLRPA